jgi:hypothetical protein
MSQTGLGRFLGVYSTPIGAGTTGDRKPRRSNLQSPGVEQARGAVGDLRGGARFSVCGEEMRLTHSLLMRFPDGANLFPDHAKKFPCYGIKNSLFVRLGNWAETLDKSRLFRLCCPLDL